MNEKITYGTTNEYKNIVEFWFQMLLPGKKLFDTNLIDIKACYLIFCKRTNFKTNFFKSLSSFMSIFEVISYVKNVDNIWRFDDIEVCQKRFENLYNSGETIKWPNNHNKLYEY